MYRRGRPPPLGVESRDRKWSFDRLDDVITSPTVVVDRRRMSSPTLDYDNVFDRRAKDARLSPLLFDTKPAHRHAPTTVVARPAEKKNVPSSADNVSVVWNPDKSITMSLALPDDVDNKENRKPVRQQQQRHRNESFLMINSPARVVSPSPSRSLTHQTWTPRPVSPPRQHTACRTAADLFLAQPTASSSTDLTKFGPLPSDVLKIISPPSDAESLDSLSPTYLPKRKSQYRISCLILRLVHSNCPGEGGRPPAPPPPKKVANLTSMSTQRFCT